MAEQSSPEPDYVRQARYLGADAAMAAASWIDGMSETDARSVLDDVDPAVLDNYREPNLSGEFAGDPTPDSLALELTGLSFASDRAEVADVIADAWESGRDEVWGDALQAHALRTLGRVDAALHVERQLELAVERLRLEAGK